MPGTTHRRSAVLVAAVLAGAILAGIMLTISCSQDGGHAGPGRVVVSMSGNVAFPDTSVLPEGVTVGFGDHEATPNTSGAFAVKGYQGTAGLAVAFEPDTVPMLMAIVPVPEEGAVVTMDARSTALALAFLSPFVCASDPADAEEVLSVLGALPEIDDLEALLEEALASNPKALSQEDPAVDTALTRVVDAYLHAYPSLVARTYPSAFVALESGPAASAPAGKTTVIDPNHTVSGHLVTHLSGDNFKISNARGRWAFCQTPQEDFYIFPNGSLLDALRGRMWAPSQREFNLDFETLTGDTARIFVYGMGWASDPDNAYDDLGETEKDYVIEAGGATVLFELDRKSVV